jgi:hypothetical protein
MMPIPAPRPRDTLAANTTTAGESGVAKVRVASNLIPQLPFKIPPHSVRQSHGQDNVVWDIFTNLGSSQGYF